MTVTRWCLAHSSGWARFFLAVSGVWISLEAARRDISERLPWVTPPSVGPEQAA